MGGAVLIPFQYLHVLEELNITVMCIAEVLEVQPAKSCREGDPSKILKMLQRDYCRKYCVKYGHRKGTYHCSHEWWFLDIQFEIAFALCPHIENNVDKARPW